MGMGPPPAGRAVCVRNNPRRLTSSTGRTDAFFAARHAFILRRVGSHVPVFGPPYRHDRTLTVTVSVRTFVPFHPSR